MSPGRGRVRRGGATAYKKRRSRRQKWRIMRGRGGRGWWNKRKLRGKEKTNGGRDREVAQTERWKSMMGSK